MEHVWRELSDDLGPAKVVLLREPAVGLEGVVVVDNTRLGPAIGGLRLAPTVTVREVARLARAMTLKNAAAGLPHGGGKAGIIAPRGGVERERLVRAFAQAIRDLTDYVPGPDMGTDETCMAWVRDEIGRAVGLPEALGGIPLDDLGATGYGLAAAARAAAEAGVVELEGARVAVQGFGAVGRHAARFLAEAGARVVAVADSHGTVVSPSGIDVDKLAAVKAEGTLLDWHDGEHLPREAVLTVDCDILVPAAQPDVITRENARSVTARLILQGANIPTTAAAEQILRERGVVSLPDFIVNAGGVICAAVEHRGGTAAQAFEEIDRRVHDNTAAVLEASARTGESYRDSGLALAHVRLDAASGYGRWHR
jgi:glutamate dehydrogenase/leucine dehydrogenase